jgi:hypothetical protein
MMRNMLKRGRKKQHNRGQDLEDYNKKAFIGACDILAAMQPDGSVKSTPFMLKAKNCVIGSKIGLKINGVVNEEVGMIVNENYEACFIEAKSSNGKFNHLRNV